MTVEEYPDNTTSAEQQSQLKLLIARGKEQGYLTYAEVNDHLPNDIVDPEQIEDIVNMINDMGITVYEKVPDADALLLSDVPVTSDEEAAEEAAAALATVDSEFGRTTDPVRMYMREMGTVELLTREGEIRIAKRIEEGLDQVKRSVSFFPPSVNVVALAYEPVKTGESRLQDVLTGFVDPNQPDEVLPASAREVDDEDVPRRRGQRGSGGTRAGSRRGRKAAEVDLPPSEEDPRVHRDAWRGPQDLDEGARKADGRDHGAQARAETVRCAL